MAGASFVYRKRPIVEIYKLTLVPCTFFIDRFDGMMKYVPLNNPKIAQVERRLFGNDRKLNTAGKIAGQMCQAFEEAHGKVSYVVVPYTKDKDGNWEKLGRDFHNYFENNRWKIYRNAQGTLDEI